MKYKNGDRVKIKSLDWYNENKDKDGVVNLIQSSESTFNFTESMATLCDKVVTIYCVYSTSYDILEDDEKHFWTDEMVECLVEEETPKFKVNDIVFVKDIGWVIIRKSFWDSRVNEYIYEVIGFNEEGRYYDYVCQSSIENQMLRESENPVIHGNKITLDEYKNNDKEWLFNKLAMLDNITAIESIQDISNHLKKSKYPKTYEECCKVMQVARATIWFDYDDVSSISEEGDKYEGHIENILCTFRKLLICRAAYCKIAGEELGLDGPWEPDWNEETDKFTISNKCNEIYLNNTAWYAQVLAFPTAKMRDAFYENFKKEIEECKELL